MPKRKKARGSYGNIINQEMKDTYINKWSNNKIEKDDVLMLSLFIVAEGDSLLQIIVSENPLYNGIFHIVKFKYASDKHNKLIVKDLDVLHNPKNSDLEGLIEQLPEIARKYQGVIPENLPLEINPFDIIEELPLLCVE